MRNDLELLEILKEELIKNTHNGCLCGMIGWLSSDFTSKITSSEAKRLKELIKQFKPKRCYKENEHYYWKPGNKSPRLRAVNRLIEKLTP